MSAKGRLFRLLGSMLEGADVTSVTELSSAFRLIELKGDPRVHGRWQPGDKVQLLLPSDDVRTYTPMKWDADGATSLLVHVRDDSPASRWARSVAVGQRVRFASPQRSLVMPPGMVTLIGDETSLAVVASYARARPGQVRAFFEVDEHSFAQDVLRKIDLADAQVVVRPANAPRGETLASALPAIEGAIGITGGDDLIKRTRSVVRERGNASVKTKAYWVQGRVGLD